MYAREYWLELVDLETGKLSRRGGVAPVDENTVLKISPENMRHSLIYVLLFVC